MADSGKEANSGMITKDAEDARSAFAKILETKRAGPDGNVVRKVFSFWTTLADLDLHGKDQYRVIAAARRLVESVLPSGSLAGAAPIQARRGVMRTEKKSIFGDAIGIFEVNLVAADSAAMVDLLGKLRAVGLNVVTAEDAFDEKHCCHMAVPKLVCVQPLYKALVDLGGVTKICYAQGGGAQSRRVAGRGEGSREMHTAPGPVPIRREVKGNVVIRRMRWPAPTVPRQGVGGRPTLRTADIPV